MNLLQARSKLIHFFQTHNPDRLSAVDDILSSYENDYDQLFVDLKERYPKIDVFGTIKNAPMMVAADTNAAAAPSSSPSSEHQQQQQQTSSLSSHTPSRTLENSPTPPSKFQQAAPSPSSSSTPGRGWTRNNDAPTFDRNHNDEYSYAQSQLQQNEKDGSHHQQPQYRYNQTSIIIRPGFAATSNNNINNEYEDVDDNNNNNLMNNSSPQNVSSPVSGGGGGGGGGGFVRQTSRGLAVVSRSGTGRTLQQSSSLVQSILNDPDLNQPFISNRSLPSRGAAECSIKHRRYTNGFEEEVLEVPNEATPSILFVPKGYFDRTKPQSASKTRNNINNNNNNNRRADRPTAEQLMRGEAHLDDEEEYDYRTSYDPLFEAHRSKVLAEAKKEAEEFYRSHPDQLKKMRELQEKQQVTSLETMSQNYGSLLSTPQRGGGGASAAVDDPLIITPSQSPQRPRFLSPSLSAAWTVMVMSGNGGGGIDGSPGRDVIFNRNGTTANSSTSNNFWKNPTVRNAAQQNQNQNQNDLNMNDAATSSSATTTNSSAFQKSHFLSKPEPFSLATSTKPVPDVAGSPSSASATAADRQQQQQQNLQNQPVPIFVESSNGKLAVSDDIYERIMAARQQQQELQKQQQQNPQNPAQNATSSHGPPLNEKVSITTEYYRGK